LLPAVLGFVMGMAVTVAVMVLIVIASMGVQQVHVPPLGFFLPASEPSPTCREARVGAAIGPLLLVVGRLAGQLTYSTALTRRRTHQVFAGEVPRDPVLFSDGTPEPGQDHDRDQEPNPCDGLERVGVVAGAIAADVVIADGNTLNRIFVVVVVRGDIPPYRIVRGVGDGDAVLHSVYRIHHHHHQNG